MKVGHCGIFYTLCKFDPNSFEGSTWINDFLQSSFDFVWPRCWNWGVPMLWQLTKVFFCAHYGLQSLRCSSYFHKRAKNDLCQITCTSPSASVRSNLTSNFPRVLFLSWGQLCFQGDDIWVPYERCLREEGRSACHRCQGRQWKVGKSSYLQSHPLNILHLAAYAADL